MIIRRKDHLTLIRICFIVLWFPVTAFAQSPNQNQEPWYKIIAGIIAIPATILGLAVSYRLFRKTNLESRKLELEIIEKQNQLQATPGLTDLKALKELAEPIGLGQRVSLLILRFVILELTLRLWGVVPTAIGYLTSAVTFTVFYLAGKETGSFFDPSTAGGVTFLLVPQALNLLLSIVYWFIVFGFGWPLLKDAASVLDISISGLFDLPFIGRKRRKKNSI